MSSKHQDFAKQVLDAFAAAGCHTDKEVAEVGGPSSTTMTMLRKAAIDGSEFPKLRSDTLRRIDRAAMWRSNGARELWLNGIEPTVQTRYPSPLTGEIAPRQPKGRHYGLDGYVEMLAERVLELEERVDLLEMGQQPKEGQAHGQSPAKKSVSETGPTPKQADYVPAARKGKSQGRALKREHDKIGEESQDPDDHR